MNIRKLLIRVGAVLVCVALAATMMVIGRGHTVYFDNKTVEYEGQTYPAAYKVVVYVKGKETAKLFKRERGSTSWIGQSFHMDLALTREMDGPEEYLSVDLALPYGIDGPILNLPALLAGLPQDAWLSEFIPSPVAEDDVDVDLGDEFGMEEEGAGDILG